MAASSIIVVVAAILAIGVVAQVLAARTGIPSVVFLIAAGVVLGPEVLGVVRPSEFLGGLTAIVGLSVAIIVFEGAFHIRATNLRTAPRETLRLVTLGAVIALVGTAVVVRYALDTPWLVAYLVGALLVATGPTVITPILQVVAVRDRVATALETEGIVNDVTAAILAVVIFEAILENVTEPAEIVRLFAQRLGVGVVVGILVAAVLWWLLRHVDLGAANAPQYARLAILAGALVSYAGAEYVATESGIAAAATAGVILGNVDLPYEDDITQFKGDVTLLVLSFVFIALAALLDFESLIDLGLGGVAVVVAVTMLIRPATVLLSTVGGRFTVEERAFMSFVGPRGIIPASVATLFAIQLQQAGFTQAADILVGTVFLVILVTVVVEGGFARHVAQLLDVIPMRVIIVGGGKVGRALADRLEDRGENVVIVEVDPEMIEQARAAGHTVHQGDGADTDTLRAAGADNAKIVVAATGDDDVNLLVAQLANSKFGVDTILARVINPDNVEAFEELGVSAISSTMATAYALDNAIERPTLSTWMTELGRTGDVQEIEVTAEDLVGKTIADLREEVPPGCLIALVSREGDNQVPEGSLVIEAGDRLTILGERQAVREAIDRLHPD